MSKARLIARWIFWFPIRRCITALPRAAAIRVGEWMGSVRYRVSRRRRRVMAEELGELLQEDPGGARIQAAVHRAMRLSGANLVETFLFPRHSPRTVDRVFEFEGLEHLERALAQGKGVILLLCHFGANQLCMAALGHRGYRINQIGSQPEDWHKLVDLEPSSLERRIFDVRLRLERALPANFVYIDRSMRPVYRCLARGEILIMAFDGRAGSQWLDVPLFHRRMNISSGPFSLARRAGSPIIPLFMVRRPGGRHRVVLHPPLEVPREGPREELLRAPAIEFARLMEHWIRELPDHYAGLLAEARIRAALDRVPLFRAPAEAARP
jgi:KDO2-lipid IV(A) lauroyltransferase